MYNDIYVFVDSKKDVEKLYVDFAILYGFKILTTNHILKKEINESIITVLPKKIFPFKSALKNINIKLLILPSDTYHFTYNYLARHYKSIVIQQNIMMTNCDIGRKLLKDNKDIYFFLYKILYLTSCYCDKEIISYERTIFKFIYNMVYKVLWGHKIKSALPGMYSDYVFVSSEYSKEIYTSSGVDQKKLITSGILQDDNYYLQSVNIKQKKIQFDILFIVQPFTDDSYNNFNYLKQIESFLSKLSDFYIAVKLHPRSNIDDFTFLEQYTNITLFEFSNEESDKLLQQTKIVIGTYSSFLIYPLLIQIPIVFVDFTTIGLIDSFKQELLLYTNDSNKIKDIVVFALDDSNSNKILTNQNNFLKKFGFFDGKCHERIYLEIKKIYKEIND